MTTGVISAACTNTELASEFSSLGHGVFSYFLTQGLTNSIAGGDDGIVTAEELHAYAAPLTTAYVSDMHPQVADHYSGNLTLKVLPLSVSVSGPTVLASGAVGTYTATVTGGATGYSYQWYIRYDSTPLSALLTSVSVVPMLPSPGSTWYEVGSNSPTLSHALTACFSLKCVVVDTEATTATSNIVSVTLLDDNLEPKLSGNEDLHAEESVESTYKLEQPFPNPFNPSTQFRFTLPVDSRVRLTVYDVLGREISTVVNGVCAAGYHTVVWNSSSGGNPVSSGVYFARIQVFGANKGNAYSKLVKLLLMK